MNITLVISDQISKHSEVTKRPLLLSSCVWHGILAKYFIMSLLIVSQNPEEEMFVSCQRPGNGAQIDQKTASEII